MMDVLSRVKELLSGKKSQKRKSSISEYELDTKKRFRMSEFNGDFDLDPHIVNSGFHHNSTELRNNSHRFDSYQKYNHKSDSNPPGIYNQTNERDGYHSNYNFNNGAETDYSDFKQPLPPPLTNGTARKVPGLIHATKTVFERTMLNRGQNQPHQTVTPLYNKFGEPSELANFKNVPDLFPIKSNARTNPNASYYLSKDNLVNGHEHSAFSTGRYGNNMNPSYTRSMFATPSTLSSTSTSSRYGNNQSFFDSSLNSRTSRTNSILSNNCQLKPPENLSRTRYQSLLDMIPGLKLLKQPKKLDTNETSLHGIIDLSSEGDSRVNNTSSASNTVPAIERVNSLKTRLETKDVFNDDWQQRINEKYTAQKLSRRDSLIQLKEVAEECERKTRDTEERLKESFTKFSISSIVPEDEEEEEPVNDYPPLDQEKQKRIIQWICGRDSGTALISKFNLQISRHDIQTLQWNPLTWLNDEVINFYMELLAERSRQNEKLPKVHGMNTFFLKRLMETGYSGVRRWTRKVDIFEHDIIPIPVHKGIHWCMAIIHLKNKTIKYYDSMGAPNNPVLSALADYLKSESLDKKKVEFDMSGWTVENVKNIPQQENGSDCGVFSCMYAEFVTRNRPIVFTQSHMTYFRMKMVYEICTGQMLN